MSIWQKLKPIMELVVLAGILTKSPPEMEGKIIPMVHVVEEEILDDDTRLYHVSSIARYYFKDVK